MGVGGGEWQLMPCMWHRDPFHPCCSWNYMCVLAFNCCCNNYKFSGLKHTSVLSSSSWSQNSKMSFMGLKSSCWQDWLVEALEEDPFLPFSSTWGCLHSSAHSPSSSIFKSVSLCLCLLLPLSHLLLLTLIFLSPSYRSLCDILEPTWIIENNLFLRTLKLNHICIVLFAV